MTVLAFTGHRPDKLGGYQIPNPTYDRIYQRIYSAIKAFEPKKVISGMALGVDQWAVKACIELGIPFLAAVPFEGQDSVWPTKSREEYRSLLAQANEVEIISPGNYSAKAMHVRNHWMVDNCDVLIAVWNGDTKGGTYECLSYAKSVNRIIFRIPVISQ